MKGVVMKPQVWVSKHGATPSPDAIEPIVNCDHWKPLGGLWTSTLEGVRSSDWIRWLTAEDLIHSADSWATSAWLLQPAPSRLLEIRGVDDLRAVLADYERREVPFRSSSFEWLDFEAMAQDFDGIWFPDPWADRFASMFLYGLDAESTIWFRWCFTGKPVLLRDFTQEEVTDARDT